jgi:hypothetical protein
VSVCARTCRRTRSHVSKVVMKLLHSVQDGVGGVILVVRTRLPNGGRVGAGGGLGEVSARRRAGDSRVAAAGGGGTADGVVAVGCRRSPRAASSAVPPGVVGRVGNSDGARGWQMNADSRRRSRVLKLAKATVTAAAARAIAGLPEGEKARGRRRNQRRKLARARARVRARALLVAAGLAHRPAATGAPPARRRAARSEPQSTLAGAAEGFQPTVSVYVSMELPVVSPLAKLPLEEMLRRLTL